ncbi:MAG: polyprenyl diphosphate synthase [Limisphaerales bacterium]
MIKSSFQRTKNQEGLHVAIIMDGNGRWAQARGLARTDGHRAGAWAVRETVEAAPGLGIGTLTLFAFSHDNWQRPRQEWRTLLTLLRSQIRAERDACIKNGVKVSFIGRRDRLPLSLSHAIENVETATAENRKLHLRIALDYSGRDAILRAVQQHQGIKVSITEFSENLGPAVDLLIRTGGEKRLSDFLLWECAYAELYFTDKKWPDFRGEDLKQAVEEFNGRQRRFGRVPSRREQPNHKMEVAL